VLINRQIDTQKRLVRMTNFNDPGDTGMLNMIINNALDDVRWGIFIKITKSIDLEMFRVDDDTVKIKENGLNGDDLYSAASLSDVGLVP